MVIDVGRATREPARAVLGAVAAGCNPVRLVTSAHGDTAYVTARTDNELLAFDTRKILIDTGHALIGRVPVGSTPVGVATLNGGRWIAVTNSNRFAASNAPPSMTLIDARRITGGRAAVLGTLPTGAFPRELSLTPDQRTLLLTNFDSKTLAVIDIARIAVGESRSRPDATFRSRQAIGESAPRAPAWIARMTPPRPTPLSPQSLFGDLSRSMSYSRKLFRSGSS